jgi:ABC-type branched-subunit amino acid transport system ATPase component
LLLDEPFEGLAPAVVQELFTVFDRLRKDVSVIIVEHNLDLVLALADRVFALERGAVFHEGPAEPLLTDLAYRKQVLWLAGQNDPGAAPATPKTGTYDDQPEQRT